MFQPGTDQQIIREAAFLREARDANSQAINSRLRAAGFDDIQLDEVLVLGAMAVSAIHLETEIDLTRMLGIAEQAAIKMMDTLILRGYLERRVNPNDRGRPVSVPTERGLMALTVTRDGVNANRWAHFPFRAGDIVISTLPKSGTTWVQMICALAIFLTPHIPAPLSELSPWMESNRSTRDEIYDQLAAQDHRRFIKAHLPLSDLPINSPATYVVVARHPLDVAVSTYHQNEEYHRAHIRRHGGGPELGPPRATPREWLLHWIREEASAQKVASLPHAMRHLSGTWAHHQEPNVVLLHYEDLSVDLEGEMRRLAARLELTVPDTIWPSLAAAATLEHMRAAADRLQPLGADVLTDPAAFFRSGTSGAGRELLTSAELAHYHARTAQMAPPDLLAWLHRGDRPDAARQEPRVTGIREGHHTSR
jgi:aryl sulfotransferase